MSSYVLWASENPLLSAVIPFAVLGTIGEIISYSLRNKGLALPGKP